MLRRRSTRRRETMAGICGVAGCQEAKAKGKAVCKTHRQKEERRRHALANGTPVAPPPATSPPDDGFEAMREENHALECDLTHEETRDRGVQLARVQGQILAAETRKKEAMAQHGAE